MPNSGGPTTYNYPEMERVGSRLSTHAGTVETTLGQVTNSVNQLVSGDGFGGKAEGQYAPVQQKWNQGVDQMHAALTKARSVLAQAGVDMNGADVYK
nr:WXG100 family type VII secretion target [Kibdelosporangium sp. MJ126-NF4]CEL16311.1 hypothetical protein [Kibdelosporangium sp. MJ126-NF4]CTQ94235.1 hypothetical protein [Kibdelosporangium sp. MJ126-NF4]